ncbi:unnamed protein product [Nippostrongylus brasiliensis]|uniref:M20_dimer domain-containing protein n=1 Tax=Nippostrongylus brasiliensis TaxID=27835 RepID=A0A0N4YRD5_NIPBR|nr:unnamed protein product [Nippostrongylus brasiliensis]
MGNRLKKPNDQARLEKLGATCSLEDIGKQTIDGKERFFQFCFEAMEESGSLGLEELLIKNKDKFLADVDFTCISDSYWLGTTKPCLTHGLRGICSFAVEVTGIQQDLHSGVFGGVVHEPLSDLIWVMSQLTSVENRILIPGEDDLTREKIHGSGEKTVIPSKVIGKFSIRIVPGMRPEKIARGHLNQFLQKLFRPQLGHDALPWMADINDENFRAGARAMKLVHNVDPDYIREGCSIPITLTFQELTGKSVLLLPLGAADDMAHSQNEKINKVNYLQGVKTLLAYLLELGKV